MEQEERCADAAEGAPVLLQRPVCGRRGALGPGAAAEVARLAGEVGGLPGGAAAFSVAVAPGTSRGTGVPVSSSNP